MIMDKNEADISKFSQGATIDGPAPVGINTTQRQVIFNDIGMRIDRNGVWYYQGSPINRLKLQKLFASVMRRDDTGAYWLITPDEIVPVTVDAAPFIAVELHATGEYQNQVVQFRTNIETSISAGEDHPLRVETDPETGEPCPYIALNDGLEAKLNRPTFYDLVALGVEEKVEKAQIFGVWSGGVFHKLGDAVECNQAGPG